MEEAVSILQYYFLKCVIPKHPNKKDESHTGPVSDIRSERPLIVSMEAAQC